MRRNFFCVDGHTCGNPVRLVAAGGPQLRGDTIQEKRLHFLEEYDWIRTGLMFEPRGHDMMSGSILYPPSDPANDTAVLFIETSGCLPMCGHGTIGTVTMMLEQGLVQPKTPGKLRLETPAGLVKVSYTEVNGRIKSVRLTNIPSFLYKENIKVECPDLGKLTVDISYGGNFYAIVDQQENYRGIQEHTASELITWSRALRERLNQICPVAHPEDENINHISHVLWTGETISSESHGRNAVFYGDKAIDRSPCGTGTSARLAQLYSKGKIRLNAAYVHESYIGSAFTASIIGTTKVSEYDAIIPSIEGWARITGYNTICIDEEDDPYAHGFQVI